jgi:hypothetical protein
MITKTSKIIALSLGMSAVLFLELDLAAQPLNVLCGPVTYPANGHLYYLLDASTWIDAEHQGYLLGGHLVTINDEEEQDWVYSTFSNFGGVPRHLWIGLYDTNHVIDSASRLDRQGEFVWINGESSTYRNWSPFEPNNSGGIEEVVHMWYPSDPYAGYWNDFRADANVLFGAPLCGVIEVDPNTDPATFGMACVAATSDPDVGYVAGSAQKISQIVGDWDRERQEPTLNLTETQYHLTATDLGVPFAHDGRTYVMFGDTSGGSMWYSSSSFDSIAYSTDTDLHAGLNLTFLSAGGCWTPIMIPGITQCAFEVPTEGVSVGGLMYIYFTTDHSGGKVMGRSVLAVSDDDGQTFSLLYTLSTTHFINVSVVKAQAGDWPGSPSSVGEGLYLFGSGEYRFSNVHLAFQPADAIGSRDSLQYFAGLDRQGNPCWTSVEADAWALFDQPQVGELSVSYNPHLRRWLMLYNAGYPRGINFRTAPAPWGPWSDAQVLFDPWADGGYCHFMHTSWLFANCDNVQDPNRDNEWGGEYGPYQFKEFAEGSDGQTRIYFTMSTWNPYTSVLMRADLQRQTAPDVTLLVPRHTVWRYRDDGSNQGTAWRGISFDDVTWRLGHGEFGYGYNDLNTPVGSGPPGAHFVTTYFRKLFDVPDPAWFSSLRLRLKREDGAVVYINNQEVFRSNMPGGPIAYDTLATSDVPGNDWIEASLPTTRVFAGQNVIAVELHLSAPANPTARFDLELAGLPPPPKLAIQHPTNSATDLQVTWPAYYSAYVLETAGTNGISGSWQPAQRPGTLQDGTYVVRISPTNASQFYRLHRQ